MAALRKSLVNRISDGLVNEEDPRVLAKEVGLPLEDVLAVAHNIYGRKFPACGAFTREQSDYLRHCLEYGVPHESMGRMLGVEVKTLAPLAAPDHDVNQNGKQNP